MVELCRLLGRFVEVAADGSSPSVPYGLLLVEGVQGC